MIVFSDGQVSSNDFKNYFLNDESNLSDVKLDPSITYNDLNVTFNNSKVKAIAIDPNGETFTSFTPSTTLQVSGSAGIDRVYIREGTTVDATNLKSNIDQIYLQGVWADYTKSIDNSGNLFLSRSVMIDGAEYEESVTVASGSTIATNDLLIFADGSIRNKFAVSAVKAEETGPFSLLNGFDGTIVTPLLESIIDADFIFPQSANKSVDEGLITMIDELTQTQQFEPSIKNNGLALVQETLPNLQTELIQPFSISTEDFDTNIEIIF